ncbi:hypothetical protein JXR93_00755 [bacterium]|nr:hypothetical protein [bacterium]
MRKKELVKDYKFFQVKRKFNEDGESYLFVEVRDKVEFIFIYEGEIYWRSESTPAHSMSIDELNYYPFSATVEEDEMPFQAMVRKIEEEGGLVVKKSNTLYQGYFYESKHISSRVHLFILEITDAKKVEARKDRTFWKTFGKTLAARKEPFFKQMSIKQIEASLSLEFLTQALKTLKVDSLDK